LKKTFPSSIYRYFIFSQVLNFTSVELNRFAKQAKFFFFEKTSFSKATVVMRFPAKKTAGCPKGATLGHAISLQEKMAFSTPRRVVLELPSPSPSTSGQGTYADVTIKIFRIDRLPSLLSNGAPLARYARGLR